LSFGAGGAVSKGTTGNSLGDVDAEPEGEGRYANGVGDRFPPLSFLLMTVECPLRLGRRGGKCGSGGDSGGDIIPDDPTFVPRVKPLFWF